MSGADLALRRLREAMARTTAEATARMEREASRATAAWDGIDERLAARAGRGRRRPERAPASGKDEG
jgi:hypothetical protein